MLVMDIAQGFSNRVCHGFWLAKRDDYVRVTFDHCQPINVVRPQKSYFVWRDIIVFDRNSIENKKGFKPPFLQSINYEWKESHRGARVRIEIVINMKIMCSNVDGLLIQATHAIQACKVGRVNFRVFDFPVSKFH